ncbi:hypothetical protein B5M42_004980 [Paenibacillus athensensis]|uniref:hypothetical protein n=1 Tax=Paenibacillus athensensis TaxID=1967502 RepID=UPI00106FF24B|nr:hypothetical protein [Paenibacillus athensensis]MCD1258192.1 hypothetical protein [Paenibacillus athensensis]
MSDERLRELEARLKRISVRLLPRLKVERRIDEADFAELFACLDEIKDFTFQKTDISRSLVSKLFHMFFLINRDISFVPLSRERNEVWSRLITTLAAIFDDHQFS